ncbi:hypothetical protein POM88_028784 [Heracleum sosnowskyi]|uniref:Uncharacterized protein n=1 Tax=Heracleum sosnowskyi TaxID=360622 RepID=A0AAD8HSW5_9APIA|nr:hypothetical protein POM88_028784 [Heracleum sosnowskyi]
MFLCNGVDLFVREMKQSILFILECISSLTVTMDSFGPKTLNKSNFIIWKSCMESYIVSEDLRDVMCGANTSPPRDTRENNNAVKDWEKKNEAGLSVLDNELENATLGNMTISQLFLKINNLCFEIAKLDPEKLISEARLKCIVVRGLEPEFTPFVTSIRVGLCNHFEKFLTTSV